jgi:hypothetical protein
MTILVKNTNKTDFCEKLTNYVNTYLINNTDPFAPCHIENILYECDPVKNICNSTWITQNLSLVLGNDIVQHLGLNEFIKEYTQLEDVDNSTSCDEQTIIQNAYSTFKYINGSTCMNDVFYTPDTVTHDDTLFYYMNNGNVLPFGIGVYTGAEQFYPIIFMFYFNENDEFKYYIPETNNNVDKTNLKLFPLPGMLDSSIITVNMYLKNLVQEFIDKLKFI